MILGLVSQWADTKQLAATWRDHPDWNEIFRATLNVFKKSILISCCHTSLL